MQRIEFQGVPLGLVSGNTRVHADVAKVGQEYLGDARTLRDRPMKSLSATESVLPRRHPKDLWRAFLTAAILSESGSGRHSVD